jgi:hypothetical protein
MASGGGIETARTVSLGDITIGGFGDSRRLSPLPLGRMRFLAYRCPCPFGLLVAFSPVHLLGEIAAASRRLGCPSIPC